MTRDEARKAIAEAAPALDARAVDVLSEMYTAPDLPDLCGRRHARHPLTKITIGHGAMLHDLIRANPVTRTMEIGFAYGFSTVWILAALRGRAGAHHTAIDPHQERLWHGIGLAQVQAMGAGERFTWINRMSIRALPDLIDSPRPPDLIFIDGNHRFDDVIVDMHLSMRLLKPGGFMVLDDLWMPAIRRAALFAIRNLPVSVVDQPVTNALVLRVTGPDERAWDHFVDFAGPAIGWRLRRRWRRLRQRFAPK